MLVLARGEGGSRGKPTMIWPTMTTAKISRKTVVKVVQLKFDQKTDRKCLF